MSDVNAIGDDSVSPFLHTIAGQLKAVSLTNLRLTNPVRFTTFEQNLNTRLEH
jgi:hypothetical protein